MRGHKSMYHRLCMCINEMELQFDYLLKCYSAVVSIPIHIYSHLLLTHQSSLRIKKKC